MNDFLNSLKSDLLDRRMLPLLLGLGAALVAAVAYAVLGGSTSVTPPPAGAPAKQTVGIAVSVAPSNPNEPVAETTNGSAVQRGGHARNPFAPLVSQTVKVATSTTTKTSSSSSTTTTTSPGSSSKGESVGSTPIKPSRPKTKVIVHFHVNAQFGVVPPAPAAGAPQLPAQLKTYENLTIDQPLPDKNNAQVVYLGVLLPAAKAAVFALTGEAILHGNAVCLPSATQCQALELQAGQSEKLDTIDANNNPVSYELKLVSITKSVSTASAARAHTAFTRPTKAQRELLRRAGLAVLPGLRGSRGAGTVVFAPHRPARARAHVAVQRRRPRG